MEFWIALDACSNKDSWQWLKSQSLHIKMSHKDNEEICCLLHEGNCQTRNSVMIGVVNHHLPISVAWCTVSVTTYLHYFSFSEFSRAFFVAGRSSISLILILFLFFFSFFYCWWIEQINKWDNSNIIKGDMR